MLERLRLPHGDLALPAYLPDATHGVVRSVDSADLEACGVEAVVMNTFHLMQKPGASTVKALGGLHRMAGWTKPIITDSGGFQAYSLIRENPRNGSLTDKGIIFRPQGKDDKLVLTPEKSVQLQMAFGADVVICLDDCTNVGADAGEQRASVERTVAWAKRCRLEFDTLRAQRRDVADATAPQALLFAVVQGGGTRELRRECAERLLEIGFDGYGFGGWPLDAQGHLLTDIVAYTRELIPRQYPMHALGIGHPRSVIECAAMGYEIFDCAMPTRDARRGRLYVGDPIGSDWHYVYIEDDKHIKDARPLDESCDCLACRRYTRGYLHHLQHVQDAAYLRLATIHNLRFMARLVGRLQAQLQSGHGTSPG